MGETWKPLDTAALIVDSTRPWFVVFYLQAPRPAVREWLHFPPHVSGENGLEDADYWAIEFPCGLQLLLESFPTGEGVCICANEFAHQHVARHLKHWAGQLRKGGHDLEVAHTIGKFADHPDVRDMQAFQLWRQGDDGNAFPVGEPTSRRDAECWQAELESHKHKQIYWVSPARE